MEHAVAHVSRAEKFLEAYNRYAYYYTFIERLYAYTIPKNSRILHFGCSNGFIIRSCKPSYAVGVDDSSFATFFLNSIPSASRSKFNFFSSLEDVISDTPFDYIIVSASWLKYVHDAQEVFKKIQKFCSSDTRIIIEYTYSLLPIMPQDLKHLCALTDLDIITEKRELLISVGVPLLADFLNYIIARLPIISALCLMRLYIVRQTPKIKQKEYSVSVIIPCKNEAGTIEAAVLRTPSMGTSTELILIDGNSKDSTVDVMQAMVTKYPHKNIAWFVQSAKGKKNAVEEGFACAQGEIIMILDGDITVAPEELPKFYEALASGKGECINGSRLVYPMQRGAMQPLNWFVNWTFGFMISYVIGQPIKDTLCGTKVFFKKDLKMITESKKFFGDIDPFGDFDILCGAAYCNLKILDMPVHYKSRTYGAPGIAFFKSGLQLLYMSFMVFKKLFLRR
ncbi:MAG: glycosyltransferase family 2 protein [Candidatus Babeliaceae bacterium]|nr:glycosyltransferase family 2 protein [Candidatus Babeliaceae bacterium]